MVKMTIVYGVMTGAAGLQVSQVHLALTNAIQNCSNGVAVSFASNSTESYLVEFGIEGENSWHSTTSTSDTYSIRSGKYVYTSPYLHTAYMCDLKPLTKYVYTIKNGEKSNYFYTPPTVGSDEGPTVLGVVGDPGDTSDSSTTLANLGLNYQDLPTHAILIAGDYSYANGEHEIWDKWYNVQEEVFSRVPQLGINGNHETITSYGHTAGSPYAYDFAGEDYSAYLKRTVSPISNDDKAAKRTYYSFDIGLVHLIFLDDYVGSQGNAVNTVGTQKWLNERTRQLTWLARDLEHVNRTTTPWIVVIKHNPFYNTWYDHQCQCSKTKFDIFPEDADACWKGRYVSGAPMYEPACGQQAKMETLFVEYGVNLVMAGHVHGYERTAPIVANKVDYEHGVVYITTGSGGNYEGHAGPRIPEPLPEWSIRTNNQIYGASKVIATRDSLKVLWFANTNGNEPWDTITLYPKKLKTLQSYSRKKHVVVFHS